MSKEEFKPKRKLKERYSLEGIAKSKGITVDELIEQHHAFKNEKIRILEKYINQGLSLEQAKRMAMLEIYIPGFTGPTFKD
jgi:hypothetical protein